MKKLLEWLSGFVPAAVKGAAVLAIVQAEKALPGTSGADKKAWVANKLDCMVRLPWYLEPFDGPIFGLLIDTLCEKLNVLSDRDFKNLDLIQSEAEDIAAVSMRVGTSGNAELSQDRVNEHLAELSQDRVNEHLAELSQDRVNERLAELSQEYKITPQVHTDDRLFRKAVAFVLKREGGYANHPADRGGATNMGITQGTLDAAHRAGGVKHRDVKALTRAEAEEIYRARYWAPYGWDAYPWPVSLILFDITVNHGAGGMARVVQKAIVSMGGHLAIDGKWGPKTKAALHEARNHGNLANMLLIKRKAYYDAIIAARPSQEVFRAGWYNRIRALAEESKASSPV